MYRTVTRFDNVQDGRAECTMYNPVTRRVMYILVAVGVPFGQCTKWSPRNDMLLTKSRSIKCKNPII